jgi:superfamily II DNA or RNA helicase
VEDRAAGYRCVVLVPTLDLMRQWRKELARHTARVGLRFSIGLLGGDHHDKLGYHDVLIATAASASTTWLLPESQVGLIVADEVHHYGAETWSQGLEDHFDHTTSSVSMPIDPMIATPKAPPTMHKRERCGAA